MAGRGKTCCYERLPSNIRRHAHVLCVLAQAKPKVVKQLVAAADPGLLDAISECSHNVLKGHVHLTTAQKKRLTKYKTALRTLATKKTGNRQRRALSQRGGLLGSLLGVVAPLIARAIQR